MKPNITVGVVEFGVVASYVLLFTILWRAAAAKAPESVGRAMAGAYS